MTMLTKTSASNTAPSVIAPTLNGQAAALVRAHMSAQRYLLVMDANTRIALGDRVSAEMDDAGMTCHVYNLGDAPKADMQTIRHIQAEAKSHNCDALIAVGSGTINDLVKYSAYLLERDYLVFPTAPSMNGYGSANASITTDDGHKTTKTAKAAQVILCDMTVIAAAPIRLLQSGLGDCLCRPTAQADWLLSHLLFNTHYDAAPFALLKLYEAELFAHSDKLLAGDPVVVELLMRTLLASGDGMRMAGSSHPASGGEHMIAHTYEMMQGVTHSGTHHGEEIAVTTLSVAAVQNKLLAQSSAPTITAEALTFPENALRHYFSDGQIHAFAEEHKHKQALYQHDEMILQENLRAKWTDIRDAMVGVILSTDTLAQTLKRANAPMDANDLRWDEMAYHAAMQLAPFTRNRFGFLDIM